MNFVISNNYSLANYLSKLVNIIEKDFVFCHGDATKRLGNVFPFHKRNERIEGKLNERKTARKKFT